MKLTVSQRKRDGERDATIMLSVCVCPRIASGAEWSGWFGSHPNPNSVIGINKRVSKSLAYNQLNGKTNASKHKAQVSVMQLMTVYCHPLILSDGNLCWPPPHPTTPAVDWSLSPLSHKSSTTANQKTGDFALQTQESRTFIWHFKVLIRRSKRAFFGILCTCFRWPPVHLI